MEEHNKNSKSKLFKISALCFSVFFIVVFIAAKITGGNEATRKLSRTTGAFAENQAPEASKTQNEKKDEKKASHQEIVLSAAGDCTIGTDPSFDANTSLPTMVKKKNNDYSYLFKNVQPVFSKDDVTMVNLETTFTNASSRADKTFTFKAPPEFASSLNSGSIEGVNISNNHIRDFLQRGFDDTLSTLKQYKVSYFGEGNKWMTEVKGVKVGFLGYQGWSNDDKTKSAVKKDIEELRKEGCAIVVVNFHWGIERQYYPDTTQKSLGHYAVDSGADIVIGHHPHVIQGIENYKGKIIAYSMGNFCFGGNSNPSDKDSMILQAKFYVDDNKLTKYDLKVIPCSISTVQNLNDYCPTPLEGSSKTKVMDKLNKLSSGFGFKVSDEFQPVESNK